MDSLRTVAGMAPKSKLKPDLVIPVKLHKKQLEFVNDSHRFLAVVTGIGWGKTYALAVRALLAAYGIVGENRIQSPNTGVITAPTYANLRDVALRTFLEIAGPVIEEFNKSEMRVTLKNGSVILFRSVENYEMLRGLNVSWWGGDEAALYPEIVFKIMIGRLREFGKKGYCFLATTPKGKNWIYQKWVAEAERRPNFRIIQGRSRENHYLDPEIIQSWEEEYTGDFARQELDGDFVAFEGLIYPEFQEKEPHIAKVRTALNVRHFKSILAGVDWGFTNPGVIIVVGVDSDDRLWVLHEEYRRQQRIEEWVEVATTLRSQYRIEQFFCDPSDADNIAKFVNAGLHAVGADNRVQEGIRAVRERLIIRGDGLPRFIIRGNTAPNLVKEFGQYQWASNRDGLTEQPRKANDHAMDALRYVVMGVGSTISGLRGKSRNTTGRTSEAPSRTRQLPDQRRRPDRRRKAA